MSGFVRGPRAGALGRLALDCDVLQAMGTALRLVVYTAEPGTPDHDALSRLARGEAGAHEEP